MSLGDYPNDVKYGFRVWSRALISRHPLCQHESASQGKESICQAPLEQAILVLDSNDSLS